MSQAYEGWGIRAKPALIGLALFMAVLLTLVIGAGAYYNARYAARTRPRVTAFPAPRLETIDTAPHDTRESAPPMPPPGINRAMAQIVAKGDALWGRP